SGDRSPLTSAIRPIRIPPSCLGPLWHADAHMARARTETKAAAGRVPWGLGILVVVAGAVLMALEMVGSRMLAPHFGNSVFVWGSLISVVMTALAGGYYVGGRLADRMP